MKTFRQIREAVWDQPNPKKGKGGSMTPAQKAEAKRRAKAAGRPYPNLVDNMAAMKEEASPMIKPPTNRFDSKAEAFAHAKKHGGKVFKRTFTHPTTGMQHISYMVKEEAENVSEGEGIVTPRKQYFGEPPKGTYAWERKYGKYTAKGELRKRPNPNKPPAENVKEDWQKVNKADKTDGMSPKAVAAYRRENPGSKLSTAVTEKNPTGKRKSRRASFCARMGGMKKRLTNPENARDPDSPINKALRRWNC